MKMTTQLSIEPFLERNMPSGHTNGNVDTPNTATPEGTKVSLEYMTASLDKVKGALFSGVPKVEIYHRIINIYRFRVEDSYIYGGNEIGWTLDYNGMPPKVESKSFLYKARKAGILPDWFDNEARAECRKLAFDVNGDVYIGHAIEIEDIEAGYGKEDQSMVWLMRSAAENIYGGGFEYEPDMSIVAAVMARRVPRLSSSSIHRLPRKPGQERNLPYDPSNVAASEMFHSACHYIADYEKVADWMPFELYETLVEKHRLNPILDILEFELLAYTGTDHGYGSGSGTFHGGDLDGLGWEYNY